MGKLNLGLTVILLFLLIYGFWPNIFLDLIKGSKTSDFIIQVFAVGLGVIGGMWADKKLHEKETIKEALGALEVIDAELQSNINATVLIREAINSRPSFVSRNTLPSDRILLLAKNEEKWLGKYSRQLADRGFYTVLPIISKLENRKLFEKLVNFYRDIRNLKLVFGLETMDDLNGNYSEEQKQDFIRIGERNFNNLAEKTSVLEEKLRDVDKDVVDEEKKLLARLPLF